MMIESLLIVLIFGLALYFIGSPLFSEVKEEAGQKGNLSRHYLLRKKEVMDSLKDLELDRNLQKISEEDFKQLYNQTMEEGAEVLKKLDESL